MTSSTVQFQKVATADDLEQGPRKIDSSRLLEHSDSIFSNTSDERILTLCRRASKLHFEMILVPTLLVTSRIRPELETFYKTHKGSWTIRLVLVTLAAFVVVLPWVYTRTVMPHPCRPKEVKLGEPEGHMKKMDIRYRGCVVETTLTENPFKIGELLMIISLGLTILMDLMTRFMYCMYYCCGKPFWVLNMKRLLWRPLLLFWHSWIHKKVPSLKYSNDIHVFPPLYSPPSVIVCWVYLVLILEILFIGAQSGQISFGVVLGYAMGELLLKFGNLLLETHAVVELVTQGEIRHWLPQGWPIGSMTIFDRLHEFVQDKKTKLHVSSAELLSLEYLDVKVDWARPTDRREGEDSLDGVGVIDYVYVVDQDMLVDVVSGTIEQLDKVTHSLSMSQRSKNLNKNPNFNP